MITQANANQMYFYLMGFKILQYVCLMGGAPQINSVSNYKNHVIILFLNI
jgi:hypothetical protein